MCVCCFVLSFAFAGDRPSILPAAAPLLPLFLPSMSSQQQLLASAIPPLWPSLPMAVWASAPHSYIKMLPPGWLSRWLCAAWGPSGAELPSHKHSVRSGLVPLTSLPSSRKPVESPREEERFSYAQSPNGHVSVAERRDSVKSNSMSQ